MIKEGACLTVLFLWALQDTGESDSSESGFFAFERSGGTDFDQAPFATANSTFVQSKEDDDSVGAKELVFHSLNLQTAGMMWTAPPFKTVANCRIRSCIAAGTGLQPGKSDADLFKAMVARRVDGTMRFARRRP